MTWFGYGVGDLATAFGLILSGGGAVWAFLRFRLGVDFVSHKDFAAMQARLDAVEARLATVPSHGDLRRLEDRVGAVERSVIETTGEVRGLRHLMEAEMRAVRDLMVRIDRQQAMLLRHELERETKGGQG